GLYLPVLAKAALFVLIALDEVGPAERQLRLRQLGIGRGVLDRIGRVARQRVDRVDRVLGLGRGLAGRGGHALRPARPPFLRPFAIASHGVLRPTVTWFRGGRCAAGTSDSTCAAGDAPGCFACSCWSGNSGACTPRRRAWQRSGRLRGPSPRV